MPHLDDGSFHRFVLCRWIQMVVYQPKIHNIKYLDTIDQLYHYMIVRQSCKVTTIFISKYTKMTALQLMRFASTYISGGK